LVGFQHKQRKKNTPDEPECIRLSSDEEFEEEDENSGDVGSGVQNGEGQ
jgi:hypothetical protein